MKPLRKLLPDPELAPGEHVIWKRPLVRWTDRYSIGGTLYLTNRALIFTPNLLNLKRLRGDQENYPLQSIVRIELVERSLTRSGDGGMQRRFRVVCDDGSYGLFQLPTFSIGNRVVPKGLDNTIAYLSEAVSASSRY
jgi:hypothetical protein